MLKLRGLLLGSTRPFYDADHEGAGGGQNDSGAWKAPEGLPPELAGKDASETLGKLLPVFTENNKRMEGLRTQLAQVPKAPDSADAYVYTPSEKTKAYFPGDLAKDPIMSAVRASFHKAGVPAAAFQGLVDDIYAPLIEAGLLAEPYNPQVELKNYQSAYGLDENGMKTELADNEAFAKGLFGQLPGIPEALKKTAEAEFIRFTETAGGNVVLKAIKARLGDSGIRVPSGSTGGNQDGPLTEAELKTMSADPRIDPQNRHHPDPAKRYDEAMRKRYDAGYAALAAAKR